MKKFLLLFLLIAQIGTAQPSIVSDIIDKIDLRDDPIQAVFDWVTDNIRYDVQKRDALETGKSTSKNSGFKNEAAFHTHLLKNVVNKKKGVCQDYSLLFHTIVTELGYESFIIQGYTKNNKGTVNRKIGHTWNAVKVNDEWKLYDPTWGAGYINGNKFVKRYNSDWYEVAPNVMLKDHMPYDHIWQFSKEPITYKDFENKYIVTNSKLASNNTTSIDEFLKKGKKEQMEDQLKRSKALGTGNRLVELHKKRLTKNIGLFDIHTQPELLKALTTKSNESVKLLNDYINAKNKKFKQKKWTKSYAKKTLEQAKQQMTDVIAGYKSLEVKDKKATAQINKAIRYSEKLLTKVNTELRFVARLK